MHNNLHKPHMCIFQNKTNEYLFFSLVNKKEQLGSKYKLILHA